MFGNFNHNQGGQQRIPPVSLRSRVGMTRAAIATFVGSTFVGTGFPEMGLFS
jgi:hypothetical protein